jgi:pyruvate dehydrogenase E1 component alpha subunit
MTSVGPFQIRFTQFLDHRGEPTQSLPPIAADRSRLIALYRAMVLARTFDAKAIALQRTGKLGTYASFLGQEALGVGVGAVMRPEDVLLPSYRESALMMMRGVTLAELLVYWSGDERGSDFHAARSDFPICITVAAQCCHAVGAAYAFQLRNEPRVAVCLLGDGATSKGDFYEALNAAGVWKLPLVFVINNNQWAISAPLALQTAAHTLAQKAIAAGIDGEQVDGNDVIAVQNVMERVLEKARTRGGPTLIEAVTYRLSDHTTADDASRYRDPKQLSEQWAREPVLRLRNYLGKAGAWSKTDEEALLKECTEQVAAAVEQAQATPPPRPEAMFEYLYASLPASLAAGQPRGAARRGTAVRSREWLRSRWWKLSIARSRTRCSAIPQWWCWAKT